MGEGKRGGEREESNRSVRGRWEGKERGGERGISEGGGERGRREEGKKNE